MRLYSLILLFLLAVLPVDAQQQSVTWLVWTYDDLNGEMIQLDSTGFTRNSLILPSVAGYSYPQNVAVSPQGDLAAYTLTSNTNQMIFTVYDLVNDVNVLTYNVPTVANANTSNSLIYAAPSEIFSINGQRVAFAYAVDLQWVLSVFDVQTGAQTTLTPSASNLPTGEIPVPMWVNGDDVHFIMVPLAAGGFASLNSYVWNVTTNNVQATDYFPTTTTTLDTRTGEAVFTALDTRFADRTNMGIHMNSVQVYAPALASDPFPFYVDEINTLDNAWFIQNSERVLLQISQIDGDAYGTLAVVERDGTLAYITPYENLWIEHLHGVGDGFVFSASTSDLARYFPTLSRANTTAVIHVPTGTQANVGRIVFTGISGTTARVVWAGDVVGYSVPNTNAWAQVGVVSGNPPIAVTGVSDALVVGGQARVTPEGAGLNLRAAPSVNAAVITQLNALDILNVVGGSQVADGLVWWQLSDGIVTGWAAAGDQVVYWLEVYTGTLPPPANNPPTVALGAPILLSPQPDDLISAFTLQHQGQTFPLVFEWQGVSGAVEYVLEFDQCLGVNDRACSPLMAFYTPEISYGVNLFDFGFGEYRWRVVATDAASNSAASEWRYFSFSNQ